MIEYPITIPLSQLAVKSPKHFGFLGVYTTKYLLDTAQQIRYSAERVC